MLELNFHSALNCRGLTTGFSLLLTFALLPCEPNCIYLLQPGIPEFDFPLPANAAGGTTGIYVNGRILAHRDLAMLRQRNFPQKPGKRYTLDIGGTLKDEETGKVVSWINMADTSLRSSSWRLFQAVL